ncbi:FAD-dependent monooxygenase, partial [Amylibacter sp.]|nr:FAD-dependent monooxygenase [Amylibacter sp.]
MDYDTEILIVGGGLIGSAMAIALSSIGFDITVVDRQSNQLKKSDIFDGRAYALSHASVRMLKALGLWDSVKKNTQPILDIKVSDGRVGEGASDWFLHFDHQELEEGPMGHLIEDRYIREAF